VSGSWTFTVNLNFVQVYGVSIVTSLLVTAALNETYLHDVTIINEGNNVDMFLVTLSAGDLQDSILFQTEAVTFTTSDSGFLELESYMALTVPMQFDITDPELVGLHSITLSVTSLGAQNIGLSVVDTAEISVNVVFEPSDDVPPIEPDNNGNNSHMQDDPYNTAPDKDTVKLNPRINWFYILVAIVISIMFILGYTWFLMRKTRKKFEVYRTAQEILESKKIDSASPLVANFLSADKGGKTGGEAGIAGLDFTPVEAATVKEAFKIGSGRYSQAEEELPIMERPYRDAAKQMQSRRGLSLTPPPIVIPMAKRYQPEHMAPPSARPYRAAAHAIPMASRAPDLEGRTPRAVPMARALDLESLQSTKPMKPSSYRPEHISVPEAKPYGRAHKLMVLQQKLNDGTISRELYEELKQRYIDEPTKAPMAEPESYRPDHMAIPSAKPYDRAAKLEKLKVKLREGKISRRLYEELRRDYT
jgi:hypothetical protein